MWDSRAAPNPSVDSVVGSAAKRSSVVVENIQPIFGTFFQSS